eukprot:6178575-Pleurochrysis_carterae.AAC.6
MTQCQNGELHQAAALRQGHAVKLESDKKHVCVVGKRTEPAREQQHAPSCRSTLRCIGDMGAHV